ncbi:hypothetical protein JIN85_11830 [Luteolibacter pohnpeiensis]|uniref:DUF3298 domain-containing protein n=1 Tax=Luteolibacter pohnpeiensis TaxID=454153 RepID=A0A934S876_9BACT|nr:hypothetical protein [Luteolibacter pohnpeiensis]MBK1883110.1 hypothetical protein [Luteolibacter pohnpeiensis]
MENLCFIRCFLAVSLFPVAAAPAASTLVLRFPDEQQLEIAPAESVQDAISLDGVISEYFADEFLERFNKIVATSTAVLNQYSPGSQSFQMESCLIPAPLSTDGQEGFSTPKEAIADNVLVANIPSAFFCGQDFHSEDLGDSKEMPALHESFSEHHLPTIIHSASRIRQLFGPIQLLNLQDIVISFDSKFSPDPCPFSPPMPESWFTSEWFYTEPEIPDVPNPYEFGQFELSQ